MVNIKNSKKVNLIYFLVLGLLCIGSLLYCTVASVGNYQKIAGKVTDKDENVLENASIELCEKNGKSVATTTSNSTGKYEFNNIKPGKYYLKYSYSDKEIEEIDITRLKYEYETEITGEVNICANIPIGYEITELENKIKNATSSKKINYFITNEYETQINKTREALMEEVAKNYGRKSVYQTDVKLINIVKDTLYKAENKKQIVGSDNVRTYNIYLDEASKNKRLCDYNNSISVEYDYEKLVENIINEYGAKRKIAEEGFKQTDNKSKEIEIKGVQDNFDTTNINVKMKIKVEEAIKGEYLGNSIKGKVIDEIDSKGIEGVGVELYEADGTTKALTADGNEITARTDSKGEYKLERVPGAGFGDKSMQLIPKEYTVKFTYGDKEQFEKASSTKYNGQDYESVEAKIKEVTEEIVTEIETEEEVEEEAPKEVETVEEKKVDIYLVIDCSGSMKGTPIELVKDAANKFVKNAYDIYR